MCKYCALLSYTQFSIIIGLKTDSLLKGDSSEAQYFSTQLIKDGYPKQVNLSTEILSTEHLSTENL